ncbi:hypothetical protein RND71_015575 [Anisodus tanguticus]|uniref:Uncharacterized protein n=1 Tax=Anisodus tanguticus TaxID=243964 RepID=A0AAE1S7D1_9SOLA|nr:hypothetical protein RND71_015575 [Anisodus tanguticus]
MDGKGGELKIQLEACSVGSNPGGSNLLSYGIKNEKEFEKIRADLVHSCLRLGALRTNWVVLSTDQRRYVKANHFFLLACSM